MEVGGEVVYIYIYTSGGKVYIIIYLSLHCHHQKDFCIKMGSDESHFNVSLIVTDKVTRQCPQTTTFEEKGEPKRIRTEVLLLTSLTPYRQAKPAHYTSNKRNINSSVASAKFQWGRGEGGGGWGGGGAGRGSNNRKKEERRWYRAHEVRKVSLLKCCE